MLGLCRGFAAARKAFCTNIGWKQGFIYSLATSQQSSKHRGLPWSKWDPVVGLLGFLHRVAATKSAPLASMDILCFCLSASCCFHHSSSRKHYTFLFYYTTAFGHAEYHLLAVHHSKSCLLAPEGDSDPMTSPSFFRLCLLLDLTFHSPDQLWPDFVCWWQF